ncbi:tRNA cyclic N6-threonylcarbamoyladenosine(37) synthase TcdA [Teredinibacter turnerae]|uniref:tRNA cyclic N6-threonylcarbamoyladenosine(37) synthase TcdA n=1 Tax=Teredinibacter turnerae TaxID=2426 RepID=UPI00035CAA1F|nr:tRNA cyclic N6-threonylcarbamoyladenosine(37) synthase TcdA [Teredinibacter turnerae]
MTLSPDYLARFGGIARLYGNSALEALRQAHMVVVGLGGVGTWAAEALARSGVGTLTLIELDDVCVTNTNRQLHALTGVVGQPKIQVMAERLHAINPEIELHLRHDFLTQKNVANLVTEEHHVVVDAIDSVAVKAALAAFCSYHKKWLVMSGASGGKRDPTRILIDDLGRTQADPMLAKVRSLLYRHYNFAKNKNRKFRIDAVYSTEPMVFPQADGSVCGNKKSLQDGTKLDCEGGFGSATMVTGSFGFAAANRAIERYLQTWNK